MNKPEYASALDIKLPILAGFYPDPSIVRVGETFYLANSSFEYAPGVPIHSSQNLIDWKFEGHSLPTRAQVNLDGMGNSMGVFAPTLRYHDGKFFMITTCVDDKWQLIVTAETASGPWSDAVRVNAMGIDPDLAWTEDGTCYMTFASLALNGIGQVVIDPSSGAMLSEPKLVWRGTGGKFPEGPHLYKIQDHWYMLLAEGGTERGHAVTVARSANIDGPFEAAPGEPLLSNRGTDFAIQSTGHADFVQRPDSTWAMVFHGVRPKGSSPEWHILGRETCAVEIEWQDGWPKLGAPIEPATEAPVLEVLTAESELPAEWIAPGSWPNELAIKTAEGIEFSGFLGRRQTSPFFTLRAKIEGDSGAGVQVRIDNRHTLSILRRGSSCVVTWQIGDHVFDIGSAPVGDRDFEFQLRSIAMNGGFHAPAGPDQLIASVIFDAPSDAASEEVEIARLDGRYLSTEVAGGMTGRLIGIVAASKATLTSWRYESSLETPAAAHV